MGITGISSAAIAAALLSRGVYSSHAKAPPGTSAEQAKRDADGDADGHAGEKATGTLVDLSA